MTLLKEQQYQALIPDLLYRKARFESGLAVVCDDAGSIKEIIDETLLPHNIKKTRLEGRALLPGMINAHSHSFQRVIRGRTEHLSSSNDSFWTWREAMYKAAELLTPEDVYDAARMAFLEMALTGTTAVGEFHYLHHQSNGAPYADRNLLAKKVIQAACDVGIRIALLRVAYARSGYLKDANPRQARFIEEDVNAYLKTLSDLQSWSPKSKVQSPKPESAQSTKTSWLGIAPHSLRAVPLEYFREVVAYANENNLPIHTHVSEQQADVASCVEEHKRTPVQVLSDEGFLNERFTCVHAIHINEDEVNKLARANANICACPTTERNLGDGIVPADLLFKAGIHVSLGSDSHTQIDLLEDARQLEYNLRLQHQRRNILAPESVYISALAATLFECATVNGVRSIGFNDGFNGGEFEKGVPADCFTIDLNDPSVAGACGDDLLSCIVFSSSRIAVRDVFVGGRKIIEDGKHKEQEEIVSRFTALQRRLWK